MNLTYQALALQITTASVGHLSDAAAVREAMMGNIRRIGAAVAASIAFIARYDGALVRLVVLPEYSITGAPAGGDIGAWRSRASIEMQGREYSELGRIASDQQVFLAGNAYEADPNFPDLYFQTSFIVAPSGNIVLRYRRLISLYSPTPYDLWDEYLAVYGEQSLFPVANTEIGRLAAIASEEILYPEIARCHVMRGAEVLVHSTSEMGSPWPTAKDIAKRARAAENLAYLVSANAAGVTGTDIPARSTTGFAKVVDYEGRVIAEAAAGGDSMVANAPIDIAALRARRRQTGLSNTLARQPFQAYAASYARTIFHEAGQLSAGDAQRTVETLREAQRADIDRLAERGLI